MTTARTSDFWQPGPQVDISHSANESSIAFNVARVSWPKIISKVAESLEAALAQIDQDARIRADGNAILNELYLLQSEIVEDGIIPPLIHDGGNDIDEYNKELESLQPVSWHNSPWLYTECYLFRRIQACFARSESKCWQEHDIWAEQKYESMKLSGGAVVELLEWFLARHSRQLESGKGTMSSKTGDRKVLEDLLQISLWGNTADLLSLLATSSEELLSRQSALARQQLKKNVLVDDTDQVNDFLEKLQAETRSDRTIHVILDNAGFELISDLVLVAYLLHRNFCDRIVLHGKAFPWYVSDATRQDFDTILSSLSSPKGILADQEGLGEFSALESFASLVSTQLRTDPPRLVFTTDPFWTSAHPFARLPTLANRLYRSLKEADLVVFKGDLNYRKLIAGARWPAETPFETAIGPLKDMGLRILALRTCKGDTCVGLWPGQVERIDPQGDGEWTRNGKFGVISMFDGKRKDA